MKRFEARPQGPDSTAALLQLAVAEGYAGDHFVLCPTLIRLSQKSKPARAGASCSGFSAMKGAAIEIGRRLNRDESMVSQLCAEYEGVRNPKSEQKIAEAVNS